MPADRTRQGRNAPACLACDPKSLTARRQQAHARSAGHQAFGQICTGVYQVFAIVKHEQRLARLEICHERFNHCFTGTFAAFEHRRDGIWHEVWRLKSGQFHQPHAISKGVH